jgi:hypothetical protein
LLLHSSQPFVILCVCLRGAAPARYITPIGPIIKRSAVFF